MPSAPDSLAPLFSLGVKAEPSAIPNPQILVFLTSKIRQKWHLSNFLVFLNLRHLKMGGLHFLESFRQGNSGNYNSTHPSSSLPRLEKAVLGANSQHPFLLVVPAEAAGTCSKLAQLNSGGNATLRCCESWTDLSIAAEGIAQLPRSNKVFVGRKVFVATRELKWKVFKNL